MCCRDAQTDRPQLRTSLLERHVRTQPAEHLEPSFAPRLQLRVGAKHRLHRDRSPENEAQTGGRSAETRWRDANYGQAVIVEQDLFADDARVSSEAPPPERICERESAARARRTEGVAQVTHTAMPPSDRPSPPAERGDNSRPARPARAAPRRPRTSWDRSRRPRTAAPRADE